MPIDTVYFRGEEEVAEAIASQKKRCETRTVNVDKIIDAASTSTEELDLVTGAKKLDAYVKAQRYELEQMRAKIGAISKTVAEKAKKKENFDEEKAQIAKLRDDSTELTARVPVLEAELSAIINKVGNIVHPTVPVASSEDHNNIERIWGVPTMTADNLHHHELLDMIDGYESARGVAIAGHRAYFLKGVGVMLNQVRSSSQYSISLATD